MEAALSRFLRGELTCLLMDRACLVFFLPRASSPSSAIALVVLTPD